MFLALREPSARWAVPLALRLLLPGPELLALPLGLPGPELLALLGPEQQLG